ncbi:MAG: class I SAM-dependent methyltransferase [Candidatus Nanohalobium sp.]
MAEYDSIAEDYSERYDPLKEFSTKPSLLKAVGNVEDQKVLDLACGSGYFTRELAKMNPEKIIGVDKSNEMIEIAKEKEDQD